MKIGTIRVQNRYNTISPFWQGFRRYVKTINPKIHPLTKKKMSQMCDLYSSLIFEYPYAKLKVIANSFILSFSDGSTLPFKRFFVYDSE